MPRPHPPEFRQRAVELAQLREKPVARIAEDLDLHPRDTQLAPQTHEFLAFRSAQTVAAAALVAVGLTHPFP